MSKQTLPPIRTVAVIGAGISGVCSAAHLLKQGLSVTVFERSSTSGGVWHFDPRSAREPAYPNEVASLGDYDRILFNDEDSYSTPPHTPERISSSPSLGQMVIDKDVNGSNSWGELSVTHAPPGPCYVGLKNNVALTAMKTSLAAWPPGLEEFVSQQYLEEYVQLLAETHDVNAITQYNTRVEDVSKIGEKWRVRTTTLPPPTSDPSHTSPKLVKKTVYFDAVVIATGHYHMPRVPDVPGLSEWKAAYPDRIEHSKGYRNAEKFSDKNVLIIGAGVSSCDIAKEINIVGGRVFQSSRGGIYDLPASMLPASATRIPGISSFILPTSSQNKLPTPNQPIPGRILLTNGQELTNIHHIILATGYITSYPFLPTKHSDTKTAHEADDHILVTREGTMVHNLHKDIFYIPDPTLSFIGIPYHISTFSLFDFQAQVVARIYAGRARLPSQTAMRAEYSARVKQKDLGREFHSLRASGAEIEYVRDLVDWMNEDLSDGGEAMVGHTEEWHVAHRKQREMLAERLGADFGQGRLQK
ncbi:hypothetical protein H2198_008665 [Neophaeococcomyces mojaviensis]|uniref:Uncharacterized protein n=1 Tax=Neophaeococcomyces mojaviensis TaxID=3383035 RepID=A0ACC2ZWU0_9EURO|nr:hypothetical protein H2198_008665 [Knufia sp. JES_112]